MLYISSHGEARNIKFGQQVNIIEKVPLGTPAQVVVMTVAHNHMTNLSTQVTEGLQLSWAVKATLYRPQQSTSPLGFVTLLPFDHVTLINLYISSYREATGATFIQANV